MINPVWRLYFKNILSCRVYRVLLSTAHSTAELTSHEVRKFEAVKEKLQQLNISAEETLKEYEPLLSEDIMQSSIKWQYARHIFFVLLSMVEHETTENADLFISPKKSQRFHAVLRKGIKIGLSCHLTESDIQNVIIRRRVIASASMLDKIVKSALFKSFGIRRERILLLAEYFCSLFFIITYADPESKKRFGAVLANISSEEQHSHVFEILFLVKGRSGLPLDVQKRVHIHLLKALYRNGSFTALCDSILPDAADYAPNENSTEGSQRNRWQCCMAVAHIIGRTGYSKAFYSMIIEEILAHISDHIQLDSKKRSNLNIDVAVECLNRLYSLPMASIKKHIEGAIFKPFNELAMPNDLLTGAILLSENETEKAVEILHTVFCSAGPSHVTLASKLLVDYVPLLIQLHEFFGKLPSQNLRRKINSIIVKCLSNRDKNDFNEIVDQILFEDYPTSSKILHRRVEFCSAGSELVFRIAAEEEAIEEIEFSSMCQSSMSLLDILKQSNHNPLIQKIFFRLLQLLSGNSPNSGQQSSADLLFDTKELMFAVNAKFKRKMSVIYTLSELIDFKPFQSQLSENSNELCEILNDILNEKIEESQLTGTVSDEDSLFIILTVVENLLHTSKRDSCTQVKKTLQKLQKVISTHDKFNVDVKRKLKQILDPELINSNSDYHKAKELLSNESAEPYMRAYGIMTLLKLVQAEDESALLNKFEILALTMKVLRAGDSYIFLNCIKLLTALMYVLEQTVLDTLIAEYHYDFDAETADIDFNLKIGEVIMKVVGELGEMSYKYKDTLIMCFLRGCYHRNNEFRTSNISNLGNVLKILSYQTQNYFNEVKFSIPKKVSIACCYIQFI